MFATEILRKEHDAILKMLDALDQTSLQLLGGASVQPSTLQGLLEFFQLFADRCHHGKEEDLLFPLLEQRGIPRERGPIGVMLSEHDQGRDLIQKMKAAAADYEKEPQAAGKRWSEAARVYSQLLREHIMKENNILFRMAEQMLTPEEQTSLAAEFTLRQQQLVTLIAKGLTNKEIASQLNLSEFTVRNHIHNILKQVDASSRSEAVETIRACGYSISS